MLKTIHKRITRPTAGAAAPSQPFPYAGCNETHAAGRSPIRIEAVRVTAGIGGHWINDQMAVQTGATADGYFFEGPTSSTAFPAVRSPSVAYLVSLDLADGQTAHGDCTTVANAGYAGRPLPLRREDVQAVQAVLQESLAGRSFAGFREAAGALDAMPLADTLRLPVEYGVSQALLEAAALASRTRMVDVLCREFGRPGPTRGPGFAGSCGGAWEANVDKAIVRGLDMFPQSAIQSRAECERLPDYAAWIAGRIRKLGAAGYRPDLHFDFHSSLGRMLDNDEDRVLDYLATICERAAGLTVFFEDPMLSGSAAEARERMGFAARQAGCAPAQCPPDRRRMGQRAGQRAGVRRIGRGPCRADQDAGQRLAADHHRRHPGLPGARHAGLPGWQLQRNRHLVARLHPRGPGVRRLAHADQAWPGLRRRPDDHDQRNQPHLEQTLSRCPALRRDGRDHGPPPQGKTKTMHARLHSRGARLAAHLALAA